MYKLVCENVGAYMCICAHGACVFVVKCVVSVSLWFCVYAGKCIEYFQCRSVLVVADSGGVVSRRN